jgi:hypothetical protein
MGGLAQDPRLQQQASGAGVGNFAPERMIAAPNSNPIVSRLLAGLSPALIALGNMAGNVPATVLPNGAGGMTVTAPAGSLPPALSAAPPGGAPAGAINPATTAAPATATPAAAVPAAGSPSMPTVPVSPLAAWLMAQGETGGGGTGGGGGNVSGGMESQGPSGPNAV